MSTRQRIKVLFSTSALGGGGAESHALRVMNHLDRDRFSVDLAVSRGQGSYEKFLAPDIRVHETSSRHIPSSVGRNFASVAGLSRLLRREPWDVVLSVMDIPNLAAMLAALSMPRRPAVMLSVQIPPSIEYARSAVGRRVVLPGIKRLYPHADRIVSLSYGVRGDLEALQPALAGKIDVIHNAIMEESFLGGRDRPTPGFPTDNKPVLVACGRLIAQKDYPTLLDAFRKVVDSVPSHLVVLGEGPDRAALVARIAELNLVESVHLLGFQDYPAAYMAKADVFVLSSIYEGFGNVIVEAMACDTAVVSTDCPHGPSEILEDGVTGRLVPVRDPSALAKALVEVLRDPEGRARMIERARARSSDFTAAKIAGAYGELIARVVDTRRRELNRQ